MGAVVYNFVILNEEIEEDRSKDVAEKLNKGLADTEEEGKLQVDSVGQRLAVNALADAVQKQQQETQAQLRFSHKWRY